MRADIATLLDKLQGPIRGLRRFYEDGNDTVADSPGIVVVAKTLRGKRVFTSMMVFPVRVPSILGKTMLRNESRGVTPDVIPSKPAQEMIFFSNCRVNCPSQSDMS